MSSDLVNAVEFLVAYSDHTWDTVVENVPASIGVEREALTQWAEANLMRQARFGEAAMVAVYHIGRDE